MFTLTQTIADVQNKLDESGEFDFDEKHYVKACGKWAASGFLDVFVITGVMATVLAAVVGVEGLVNKVKK